MKILITGGSGMVGRNLLDQLSGRGHELLSPGSAVLDLRDYATTTDYLAQHVPDLVVHAAGHVGGIQANMREPVRFLVDNLDMGRNIVLGARAAGVKRLINLGSSCMYPRNVDGHLTEDMVLKGELEPTNEGYAIAKITAARLCAYIGQESPEYAYKTLIPCNLYGPYDKFDPAHSHLIPAILHKLHEARASGAEAVEIWGDGNARREFMYAGDLAACVAHAIDHYDSLPAMMNVGLGEDATINDYYRLGAEVVGYTGRFTHDLSKPVGMARKLVSIDKAVAWGWRPQTSWLDGMKKTYNYYLSLKENLS